MKNLIPPSLLAALMAFFVPVECQNHGCVGAIPAVETFAPETDKVDDPGWIGPSTPETTIIPVAPDPVEADPPAIEPWKPVKLIEDSAPKILDLRGGLFAILNKTNSWDALAETAYDNIKADALIDIHFNKYRGKNSGPLVLYNKKAFALAAALQKEFIKIYQEEGWEFETFEIRVEEFAILRRGDSKGKPALISEFCFCDDPKNPVKEFMRSERGHNRLALAYRRAVKESGHAVVALSAGHHGNRGSGGARFDGYSESEFAEDIFNALARDGYQNDEAKFNEILEAAPKPPEKPKPKPKPKPVSSYAKPAKECKT